MPLSSPPNTASPALHGRLCVVLAALLWSLGGAFGKLLTRDTGLGLNDPPIGPMTIAFYRCLFAGMVLLPMLRRADFSFRPLMLLMVACFAIMNGLYLSALVLGTAANAVVLQYTAPMWMYLACVWLLGEAPERRNSTALMIGLVGVGVILLGGWHEAQAPTDDAPAALHPLFVVALGLGSGVFYAGVIVCLRVLRDASAAWLTVLNHLGGAAVLAPFIWGLPAPSAPQLALLAVYGGLQMGFPYFLMARGLRTVSPQEAGTITLLEPILNPVWAILASGEQPTAFTLAGGAFILAALAWRYGLSSGESGRGEG